MEKKAKGRLGRQAVYAKVSTSDTEAGGSEIEIDNEARSVDSQTQEEQQTELFEDELSYVSLELKEALPGSSLRSGIVCCIGFVLGPALATVLLTALILRLSGKEFHFSMGNQSKTIRDTSPIPWPQQFPAELLDEKFGAYDPNGRDFVNSDGNTPPFWQDVRDGKNSTHWGPCMPPKPKEQNVSIPLDWRSIVHWNQKRSSDSLIEYPKPRRRWSDPVEAAQPWGRCLPGFIIIGAGKCGTSSLYHYITGHDRVLPASEKQIHYFKYFPNQPMGWYLDHFPTSETFLGSGALMTGEASPGYLPYADVVRLAAKRLPGPKFILAARDPLDRAYSSYKYNYVVPALERAMKGTLKEKSIPKGMSEDYYRENHLFSFEQMLRAELSVLRDCFAPGGKGEKYSRDRFGKNSLFKDEFKRRDEKGLPPLIDLDESCYGGKVSRFVPRRQWIDLIKGSPDKIINLPNLHLVQSFIGRSLYVLPLEWWYTAYPAQDIYLVCNEEMRDNTVEMLNALSSWLGLPEFDFNGVVAEGMYNVGDHRGYDEATPWDEIDPERTQTQNGEEDDRSESEHDILEEREEIIPISDEFREELLDFVRPYNERLFQLTGQRCDWL